MTLQASGTISLANVNSELGLVANATRSLGDSNVRGLAGVASGLISMSNLYGKSLIIPAVYGGMLFTANAALTLPVDSGTKIRVTTIGGGGGGGGGNSRGGYGWGGGGGGGSGYIATQNDIAVTPGQLISIVVGAGGVGSGASDNGYSYGTIGGTGGTSYVVINGIQTVIASGGSGGALSTNGAQIAAGGSGLRIGGNSYAEDVTFGGGSDALTYRFSQGGSGAEGVLQNGVASGGNGVGGIGTWPSANGVWGNRWPTTGTGYGAGGGGGGTNGNDNSGFMGGVAGNIGAVFVEWGY